MRIHYLQHVPFEGLGSIEPWLSARGARISCTRLHNAEPLPDVDQFDWLIVLGGPMSVNDESVYPWLTLEQRLISRAIAQQKSVLGICLGAQLIARALGSRVVGAREREIGWFPVRKCPEAAGSPFSSIFPDEFDAFHWHGEMFHLPEQGVRLISSAGCENQAFTVGSRIAALQFHLETTPQSARQLVENCSDDLRPGPYVQNGEQILGDPEQFARINRLMEELLEKLASAIESR